MQQQRLRLSWPAVVLLAACTHDAFDGSEPHDPDNSTGHDAVAPPQCTPESVEGFPVGEPVWTQQEIDACTEACPGAERSCRRERCDGGAAHDACVLDSLEACLTQPGAPCRSAWEDYSCCSLGCEDLQSGEMELLACIADRCEAELDAYSRCTDAAIADEHACVAEAEIACVVP